MTITSTIPDVPLAAVREWNDVVAAKIEAVSNDDLLAQPGEVERAGLSQQELVRYVQKFGQRCQPPTGKIQHPSGVAEPTPTTPKQVLENYRGALECALGANDDIAALAAKMHTLCNSLGGPNSYMNNAAESANQLQESGSGGLFGPRAKTIAKAEKLIAELNGRLKEICPAIPEKQLLMGVGGTGPGTKTLRSLHHMTWIMDGISEWKQSSRDTTHVEFLAPSVPGAVAAKRDLQAAESLVREKVLYSPEEVGSFWANVEEEVSAARGADVPRVRERLVEKWSKELNKTIMRIERFTHGNETVRKTLTNASHTSTTTLNRGVFFDTTRHSSSYGSGQSQVFQQSGRSYDVNVLPANPHVAHEYEGQRYIGMPEATALIDQLVLAKRLFRLLRANSPASASRFDGWINDSVFKIRFLENPVRGCTFNMGTLLADVEAVVTGSSRTYCGRDPRPDLYPENLLECAKDDARRQVPRFSDDVSLPGLKDF